MVSKCRAPVSELAVMEVDVRPRTTRSPPPDLDHEISSSSSNKRKNLAAAAPDFDFSTTTTTTTTLVKLQSWRRRLVFPENSVSTRPIIEEITTATSSPTSTGAASAFHRCSSNGCSHVVDESLRFEDLEDEKDEHGVIYKSSRERRSESSTPSSGQFRSTQSGAMESPAVKSEETSSNRSLSLSSSSAKMPAESELEEFFITAEKNIQKRFAEKYNYDIVEDVPTEGRYEWIRLNP